MEKKKSFQELIKGSTPVLVDFFAEWCGPCKAMAPILKDVVSKIGGKAKVLKIDVDRNQELAQKMGVRGVPTFVLYQNGLVKWRGSGMQSGKFLIDLIEKHAALVE